MNAKLAVLAILSLFAATANGEPAPWHVWQSRLDGKTTCAQTRAGLGNKRRSFQQRPLPQSTDPAFRDLRRRHFNGKTFRA